MLEDNGEGRDDATSNNTRKSKKEEQSTRYVCVELRWSSYPHSSREAMRAMNSRVRSGTVGSTHRCQGPALSRRLCSVGCRWGLPVALSTIQLLELCRLHVSVARPFTA
ncbi:unnamed protein product [Prorocentrum cordatum]|uniref:Uncharacterized protein n=1 Tax=Prorocentrum cordatum TaxID=2364126 RepID=A0ABN9XPA0_9DINO|nr:unnamed protein product [Polarella glacialis]